MTSPPLTDDKTPHVLPFILQHYQAHAQAHQSSHRSPASQSYTIPPLFIGLNGVQGSGKTILTSQLHTILSSSPHSLNTCVFSLDDFYLTHADQVTLAAANPDNPLLQHRGQPGTHDAKLALKVFGDLKGGKRTRIPVYDKSRFAGQGDRAEEGEWEEVNGDQGEGKVQVVIFEGWCVGFKALTEEAVEKKWREAVAALEATREGGGGDSASTSAAPVPTSAQPTIDPHKQKPYQGRLAYNTLPSVRAINTALRESYADFYDQLDIFIHVDAQDPLFVYTWRLEQEHNLWKSKGKGMSDEDVKKFVDGYYPAYELYTEGLRRGLFVSIGDENGDDIGAREREKGNSAQERGQGARSESRDRTQSHDMSRSQTKGRQMRLVVDRDRKVVEVIMI